MIRKFVFGCVVLTVAVGLTFVLAGTGKAADAKKGPAEIVLKTEKAAKPATFPHAKHQKGLDCKVCHESPNFKKGAWTMKDGHALCKDCHTNLKNENKPTGPTACTGCHVSK